MNSSNKDFKEANLLLREGMFSESEKKYLKAICTCQHDFLFEQIAFNFSILKKKQKIHFSKNSIQETIKIQKKSTELLAKKWEKLKNSEIKKKSLKINSNLKEKESKFTSLSNDPNFLVKITTPIEAGYQAISINLKLKYGKSYTARLYLDYGQGFNESDAIDLYGKSGEDATRVLHFKKKVSSIRFDPIDHKDEFIVESFSIATLKSELAKDLILLKLLENQKIFSMEILNEAFETIYQEYDSLLTPTTSNISYEEWIEKVETPSLPNQKDIINNLKLWPYLPQFSIVMPTYNTQEKYLRECIESVINQSYPHWEFCIADDASPDKRIVEILDEYANLDKRIKITKRKTNGHISEATNSAIELATGDFIVLLDHDDLISEHALYFMAEHVKKFPNSKIIYSDEDKIDEKGYRTSPHFKSDWNPDLFYSQNYVSHLGIYKTELINKIGGFRAGVEGSQDYDLLLRCLPHVKHSEIHHIPRILYHWRMIEGSTALTANEKNYTTKAGIKALQDHFKENGPDGVSIQQGMFPNTYKVNWPIPQDAPLVSLLIPTRDRKDITQLAVESIIEKTTYQNYEIIILDNGSIEKETLDWFTKIQKQDQLVTVLRYNHPFNYSAINNFGVKHAKGSIIGLVNNDIEVISPEWLSEMVSHAVRSDIGCVGAKLYYSDNTIQHGGVIVSLGGVAGHSHKHYPKKSSGYFHRLKLTQNYSAVTAACLLVRKNIYIEVGQLNEKDLKIAFNDVDFCLKVFKAGYRNIWTPYAELYHHESISRGAEDSPDKIARFNKEIFYMKKTWETSLKEDPYYNPNLTKAREDFSIRGCS